MARNLDLEDTIALFVRRDTGLSRVSHQRSWLRKIVRILCARGSSHPSGRGGRTRAMDPETQYPVDAVTTEAMKTSKPVGMDMSLDDIVKQRRNANKKRGDGKLSKGGILKVKAGVNKGGPGRSMSGTFGGRGSGPMYQKLYVHVRHTADWVAQSTTKFSPTLSPPFNAAPKGVQTRRRHNRGAQLQDQ